MSATFPSLDELKYITLTAMVNNMKSPSTFLQRLLFSNHQTLTTENIEIDTLVRGRSTAPFVRKNGEAIMVGGYTSKKAIVEAPNIRIKKPFTPSELLFGRKPGAPIFVTGNEQMTALQQHIARDLQGMVDMISNTQEWMVSQVITGTIFYSVADQETYTITYPKPAGNTVDVSGSAPWTNQTTSNILEDEIAAKRVVADEVGLGVTICLMGAEAAAAFRANAKIQAVLDNKNISAGQLTFNEQFTADGAIFLGNLSGIPHWEYSRTIDVEGVSTAMIRSKYAEYIAVSPAAENILYYGAIPDMKAINGQQIQTERFSKSWEEEDPSVLMALVHSRPLPVPRRPGSYYSLKVIAG